MDDAKKEILNNMVYDEIKNALLENASIATLNEICNKFKISKSVLRTYMNAITIYEVVIYFLQNSNLTITELSKKLKIPKSTIQRYLNSPLIAEIPEFKGEDIRGKIKKILEHHKKTGHKMGGLISAKNNIYEKDENGHFIGSKKR